MAWGHFPQNCNPSHTQDGAQQHYIINIIHHNDGNEIQVAKSAHLVDCSS
jgi:hypothetical protein